MPNKIIYYTKATITNHLPTAYYRWNYKRLKEFEQICDQQELIGRLDYYFRFQKSFPLPEEAIAIQDYKKTGGTAYYLDFKEFLHYFTPDTRFAYLFGDDKEIMPYPCIIKARNIVPNNQNNVLFKLNKNRHFRWVNNHLSYESKKDEMVWRGGAYQPNRIRFVQEYYNRPGFNVGQTNSPSEDVPWQKPKMTIKEQLEYKFIFCPEGNDVATNLKWAMSSNSLCFMPKPTCETWYMEGVLESNVHYVEVKEDFSDIEQKMDYYLSNPQEALEIINNAHEHVSRFQNQDLEDLLCLKVLEKFAQYTNQLDARKFDTPFKPV